MKTLKKIISLSISALGVLVLSGFLSLRPIGGGQDAPGAAGSDPAFAHHEAAHACNDLTGVTSGVPAPQGSGRNAGVEDSGNLDFNADPPAQSYQACAERGQVGREDVWFLKGWTWNTNLGYISFYCDGGQNFGGICSDQANPVDYETILESSGQVTGWAWGDNIGWISMTCRKGDNVGQDCGRDVGTNYSGVRVVQDPVADKVSDCTEAELGRALQRGDFYGYAWSDSVGWLNFCGAHVELESPLVPEVTLIPDPIEDIPVDEGDPGPDGIPGTGDEGAGANACDGAVYANGSDSCKIVVQIKEGGAVLTAAQLAERGINVNEDLSITSLTWDNAGDVDSTFPLRADQVTRCSPSDGPGFALCNYETNTGAIQPIASEFNWEDSENGLVGRVRAIAPTSATDQIILELLAVQIGNAPSIELTRGDVFTFLPAVEVTRISSISADSGEAVVDQISAVRGTSEAVYLTAEKHDGDAVPDDNSTISIFTQLYDCNSPYEFVFDEGEVGVSRDAATNALTETHDLGAEANRENIERATTVCLTGGLLTDINTTNLGEFLDPENIAKTITRLIFSDVEAEASPTEMTDPDALGIRTRVEYIATVGALTPQVRYFSRLVRDGSLLNQAADVRGNVRIDIQKIIREGAIAQSLKNDPKDTQSKREKFYRAIKNIINTKGLVADPDASDGGVFPFNNSTSLANGLRYFNTTNVPGGAPCKIILDDAATLSFENNVTLIGEGCDFFIDQNVISPTGRLGIVALEDLSLTGARRGGNVYICHRVTDIEANIVADGSLFAYGQSETECNPPSGNKEDLIGDDGLPSPIGTRASARRQLTIIGSLVSNNTYGGAFKSPPLLGDGTLITNPSEINKVRLYDINFLRYARTRDGDEDADGNTICWDNTPEQLSVSLGQTCDSNNPGNPNIEGSGNGIVNIIYRAPAKDMKIFGAVR